MNQLNDTRAGELLLYIASKLSGDIAFGRTKLYKMLFLIDFQAYGLFGESVTGRSYRRWQRGPYPFMMPEVEQQLVEAGRAVLHEDGMFRRLEALDEPNLEVMPGEWWAVVDEVVEQCRGLRTWELKAWSHEQRPWLLTEEDAEIPYQWIFAFQPIPVSFEDIKWARRRIIDLAPF